MYRDGQGGIQVVLVCDEGQVRSFLLESLLGEDSFGHLTVFAKIAIPRGYLTIEETHTSGLSMSVRKLVTRTSSSRMILVLAVKSGSSSSDEDEECRECEWALT